MSDKLRSRVVRVSLERFTGLYLFAFFVIVFSVWTPGEFLTSSTFYVIATNHAVQAILAVAVLVPLIAGQFDLSAGATANFTGIAAVVAQNVWHWPLWAALICGFLFGVVIGIANGFVVIVLKVNSFIATLGMASILSAALVIVTNSQEPSPVSSSTWNDLSQYSAGGVSVVVLEMLMLAVLVYWVLEWTPLGRRLHAMGSNPDAARLSGIRVGTLAWGSLVFSSSAAGFGGILFCSFYGPSLSFGPTLLLPAFAAAFLGSTQLHAGRYNVWGTLVAIYVLATGVEGLQLVSGAEWVGDMFNGVALILAVALAVGRERGARGEPARRVRRPADRPSGSASAEDEVGASSRELTDLSPTENS